MKVIIPMAGHSRRFKQAGYNDPKPFVMIDGKPMVQRSCQMFSPTDEFIFICNRQHLKNNVYFNMLKNIAPNHKIIEIETHELGPVHTALQAEEHIKDKHEPIIISYCDFTAQWNYKRFLMKAAHYDGAIAVFRGFQAASFGDTYYAYIKANKDLEMEELREKRSFTDKRCEEFASTGVYYIDSWEVFAHYGKLIMKNKPEGLKEYYASLIYNPMVKDGKKVCLFEVDKFICWGSPEDLNEYNFWSDYFANDIKELFA
jgi:NDP-sugar pyrophosphorylase family protein